MVSSQTFAASCKLISKIHDGLGCYSLSTRLDVTDQAACEAFANNTKENRFFNLLEKKDVLSSTRYIFKDKSQKLKVKKTIEFEEVVCGGLI